MRSDSARPPRVQCWPRMRTAPALGSVSPSRISTVVVLPAPFRSQQAEAFAGLDAQIHAVDSGEIAVPFHKSFDENRRLSART